MLLIFACMLAAVAAAPYDQTDGEKNNQIELDNILFVFAYPKSGNETMREILDLLTDEVKKNVFKRIAEKLGDGRSMDAFLEPAILYRVRTDSVDEKALAVDGENEIGIASRRRLEAEPGSNVEMKVLGTTVQCGLGRKRDPVALTNCQLETVDEAPEKTTKVVTVQT